MSTNRTERKYTEIRRFTNEKGRLLELSKRP